MLVRSKEVFSALLLLTLVAFWSSPAAGGYPAGFSEVLVASGFSSPTAMAFAPDGRLFVCRQGGELRVIKNGGLLPTPFLTLSVNSSGERGLLGVAFDPDFANNQYVYVYYTTASNPIHNRVSRFTANGDVALAGSEQVIVELDNLSATNHNGGAIHFGSDGKLYVAVGDNAVSSNSQAFSNRHGKILRLNPDGTIPGDNPFLSQTSGANQSIWAMGLRNPFTFNVHPGNGRMHINDVGAGTGEEVSQGQAEANYGWPSCEGTVGAGCGNPDFTPPLFDYGHSGGNCAITGGAFYTETEYPASYVDAYFYADYCGQWINYVTPGGYNNQTVFGTNLGRSAVDLQVHDGKLYYLTRASGGQVYRIDYTLNQPPAITLHPSDETVGIGQTATFTVAATGTAPLSYEWQKNTVPIAGAPDSPSYTTAPATAGDNGSTFRAVVSNPYGSDTSNSATLTVLGNLPPTPTINAPLGGSSYVFGQTINFSGSGTDPEDGSLGASAFTWKIDFHHDTHHHPHVAETSGIASGSFQTDFAETATNVFYRVYLTVTDSAGASATTLVDIFPQLATVKLQSKPGGFTLTLDGINVTSGLTFNAVVGQSRTISAPDPQTKGKRQYFFRKWSDSGAQAHVISVSPGATTLKATYGR